MSYYRKRAVRNIPSYLHSELDLDEFDELVSNQFKSSFMTWQPSDYFPSVSALKEKYILSDIDLSPPPSSITWERPAQIKSPISIDSLPSFYESDDEDLAPPLVTVNSESEPVEEVKFQKEHSNEIAVPHFNSAIVNQLKLSNLSLPFQLLVGQFKGLFDKNFLRKFMEKYPSVPFIGLFIVLLVSYWIISCFASIIHFFIILLIPFIKIALFALKASILGMFFSCSLVSFNRLVVPKEVEISEDSSQQFIPSQNPWMLLFQEIFLMPPAILSLWMAAFNDLYSPETMTNLTLRQEADDTTKISLIQYYYFMVSDAVLTSCHYFLTFILTSTRLAISIISLKCKDKVILVGATSLVALLFVIWAPKFSFFVITLTSLIGCKTPAINTYLTFKRVLGEWRME